MDMSAAPNPLPLATGTEIGRQVRIEDLPVLLAALAARQAAGLTASRVREGTPDLETGDEPKRMAVIFAPLDAPVAPATRAAGPFNTGVATRLAMGTDGEGDVHSGT